MLFNLAMHYLDCCAIGDMTGAGAALAQLTAQCHAKGINLARYIAGARAIRDTRATLARRVQAA